MNEGAKKSQSDKSALFVDEHMGARMKDIYLHYPPVGRNVIPRDVRRRATAMVKQPFYFNRNNPKNKPSGQNSPNKFLELHSWYSKRMHMRSMWGWLLPYQSFQRASDSVIKLASSHTFVHDASYFSVMIVKADPEGMQALVHTLTMNRDNLAPSCLHGDVVQTIFIYVSENGVVTGIGPVQLLVREYDDARCLWLLAHPAISAFLLHRIQSDGYAVQEAQDTYLFSLRGLASDALIQSLFPDAIPSTSAVTNATAVMSSSTPTPTPPPTTALTPTPTPTPTTELTPLKDKAIRAATFQPRAVTLPYYAPEYYRQDSTLRPPRRVYFPPGAQPTQPTPPTPSPALLIRRDPPPFGRALGGFDVLLPRAAVQTFWQELCALRPIATTQEEWHLLHACFGVPLFPYDFPDTPAGMDALVHAYHNPFVEVQEKALDLAKCAPSLVFSEIARESGMAQMTLPRCERGAAALRCLSEGVSPFLVPVHVKVVGKGRIVLPCAIKLPEEGDVEGEESKVISAKKRETIGFVTSCIWSPKASAFVGIGFCASTKLGDCLRSQGSRPNGLVLLGNDRVPFCCKARISISHE
ncbi:hypothetical protein WA556_003083, partial [Blastocystis sp. ATCC 50177/Nand II]